MKQVLLSGDGQAEVVETPCPTIMESGVLVRTAYSLISSGTEGAALAEYGGVLGIAERALKSRHRLEQVATMVRRQGIAATAELVRRKLTEPVRLGYSCAGYVLEVNGMNVPFREGDEVACMGAGYANHAEFVAVPRNLAAKIPEGVELSEAAFAALACIALQGIRRLDLTPGENVGVVGLGLIGQLTVRLLVALGYRAFGLDVSEVRVARARDLSNVFAVNPANAESTALFRSLTDGYGLDGVIVCATSRSSAPVNEAFDLCRKGGRVSMVGSVGLDLSRAKMYEKELELRLSCSYGPGRYDPKFEEQGLDYPINHARWTERRNLQLFLSLLATRRLDISTLISEKVAIDDAQKAYSLVRARDPNTFGVLFDYGLPARDDAMLGQHAKTVVRHPIRHSRSDRVGLGVIGVGSYAKGVLLPAIDALKSDFDLLSVASRSGATAAAAAKKYDVPIATSDYREVLENEKIDAVLIATRHSSHAHLILEALEAGKHVLVEKPMATSLDDAKQIREQVEKRKLILRVGFNRRFSGHLGVLKSLLGEKGTRMLAIRVNAGDIGEHWSAASEEGGRIIGEGVHFFDIANWMFDSEPYLITAGSAGDPDLSNANFSITLNYKQDACAQILYTSLGNARMGKEYFEAFAAGRSGACRDYMELVTYPKHRRGQKLVKGDKGQREMLREFAMAIRGETHRIAGADVSAGLSATRIALECLEAAKRNQSVAAGG